MEFFKKQTNIDFLNIKKWTWGLSVLLIVASFAVMAIKGINWGLDFTGGYAIQVQYQHVPDIKTVKAELGKAGFEHADVVTFGSSKDLRITLAPKQDMQKQAISADAQTEQDALQAKVQNTLSDAKIMQTSYTGSAVGAELAQRGILAMFIAILATVIYIALRFEMRFAIAAAIALAHDPIIILGIFSFFQIRFDLTALAAVLAIIGYSLNDTVVIYDRIRENFRKMRKSPVTEVINRAVNDTLSRTIITSGLTLLVVVVLFIWGGASIHNFSLALIIGVVIGTYSSIYIAGALAIALGLDREALIPKKRDVDPGGTV